VLSKALAELAPLFLVHGEALKVVFRRALRDNTAAVRSAAVSAYPRLYRCAIESPDVLRLLVREVMSLAYEQSYKKRLTFIECQRALLLDRSQPSDVLDDAFWQALHLLSEDQIVDVRIGAARIVSLAWDKNSLQSRSSALPLWVQGIVLRLAQDPSNDVRAFVLHIPVPDFRPSVLEDVTPTSSIFSQPPPKRLPQTALVAGIDQLQIVEVEQGRRAMSRHPSSNSPTAPRS